MTRDSEQSTKWFDLAVFQTNVAERWYRRAGKFEDPFVQFFFYFTGFNALYFLWACVDEIRNVQGEVAGEGRQIENLLRKIP